jgi:DNA polymerase
VGEPELRDELRRYLRQRIEAGETERLLAPVPGRKHAVAPVRTDSPAPAVRASAAKSVSPATGGDTIAGIAAEVARCTRCRLHETRNRAVPGVGPDDADIVFIGEGPGAEEDAQGKPFVGPAGQLLTKIIESVQFRREDVFITNIVKCRPPKNRDPQPDEVAACEPYLKRQLALLHPKVIVALGRHAGSWLAGAQETMGALRNGVRTYENIRVFPTYHPAALLRNPQWKRPVWEDIQKVRAEYDRLSNES